MQVERDSNVIPSMIPHSSNIQMWNVHIYLNPKIINIYFRKSMIYPNVVRENIFTSQAWFLNCDNQ